MTQKERREVETTLRTLLGPSFEALGGLAYEHWTEYRGELFRFLLKRLDYWRRKDQAWDNRVGARHLKRGGMDEATIRSGRPSDYGEER
jgi:hypothetical protein